MLRNAEARNSCYIYNLNWSDIFKEHNFRAASPFKYCKDLSLSNSDVLKKYKKEDIIDIKKSSELLDALSEFDNAQSVVCAEGYIIAIEAVEGTDALLHRSRQLRKDLDQFKTKSGFLVKKIKKSQSRFIDLPVVGPKTISLIKLSFHTYRLKGPLILPSLFVSYRSTPVKAIVCVV